jgi:hypothetical protein
MKIGIIGEDPYDTEAIRNLLAQKYAYRFQPILKNIRGDQLNSPKTAKLLKIELKTNHYPIIIYNRDLDGLETETRKKEKVVKWFNGLNALHKETGILLLHIYELEALILADIEAFNTMFGTQINFTGNPMFKAKPKEYLKAQTRKNWKKFEVSENPAIFEKLRIETVIKNCPYFKTFIIAFEQKTVRC